MINCLLCNKNPAQHTSYGIMPCINCQKKAKIEMVKTPYEFMPERILDDRRKYSPDIVQPYRDGQLSKEYLETYGTRGINPTDKEKAKAKYVFNDDKYYKSGPKTSL